MQLGEWISLATLLVTAIGLWLVCVQIRGLRHSIEGDTQARLCDQSIEIIKMLAEKPETYDYFYEKKPLEDGSRDKVFVRYASEAIGVFLENLVAQKRNMPTQQWQSWYRFIRGTYQSSPVLQDFFANHADWFSHELMSILRSIDTKP
jgi:hypothetical protein